MKKEDTVHVLLEDDNEILGNGYGHPLYRQYLPTKRYVEILNKYKIKATFYVDIAHYLFLKKNINFKDFKFQSKTIEEVIRMLLKNSMDVQMHLHSQWVNAEIKDDEIYVTSKWNIGQLTPEEQVALFNDSYEVLSDLIEKYSSTVNVLNSYKAGSWGLQPFSSLYALFKEKGIKLVMGPIKGLKADELNIDYTNLQSDFYPFYTSVEDINKIGTIKDIVVLPMTPTYLNWLDLIRYMFELKIANYFKKGKAMDVGKIPYKALIFKPLNSKNKISFGLRPYKTHLKINSQKYWLLKNTFDRSYRKIIKSEFDYKIIVIETHTKDFKDTFDDIDNFFNYIKTNYTSVKFVTSNELIKDIEMKNLIPIQK